MNTFRVYGEYKTASGSIERFVVGHGLTYRAAMDLATECLFLGDFDCDFVWEAEK